jgi:hypothetical protein
LQTFSNEYQHQQQLFSLFLDFATITAIIREMNNKSLFIVQKTVLRAENEPGTKLKAFVLRLIIPMNTGSAPSVIFIIGRNLIRPSLVFSLSSLGLLFKHKIIEPVLPDEI